MTQQLWTRKAMADELKVSESLIKTVLVELSDIQPMATADGVGVYSRAVFVRLRDEIEILADWKGVDFHYDEQK